MQWGWSEGGSGVIVQYLGFSSGGMFFFLQSDLPFCVCRFFFKMGDREIGRFAF